MRTAVIYARFSCSKQREASIEDQIRVCNEFCEREGIAVVKNYCDFAMSGRTDNRPEFQRMIANAPESDYIVVYMLDRFSRGEYDAPVYKQKLAKKGVKVLSAMESIPDSPDGIIMEKLLEALAARESLVTSQRVKRGMDGNAQKCLYNGDKVFGYSVDDSKRYVINEKEASLVREAFTRRLKREAANSIAKDFAERGVTMTNGKPFSSSAMYRLLSNERYCGVYVWGDVRVDGGMPAIIERNTFDAVQNVKGRKRRDLETFEDYTLSGRAICGSCGRNMHGASCRNHLGNRYNYYRCGGKCGAKQVRQDVMEDAIVSAIREILFSDEAYDIASMVEKTWKGANVHAARDEAMERARKARKGIENIVSAVENGMPYSAVSDRMEELQSILERANLDIAIHENDGEFSVDDFVDFLRFGATLDDATLLDAFVSQVIVTGDRYLVTLNYSEKENTPRRIEVCEDGKWWTKNNFAHTRISVVNGLIVLSLPRCA